MRLPGALPAGKTVEPFTQEIDQMPTLLALLGAPAGSASGHAMWKEEALSAGLRRESS
jgi:arylsulfatase A-like enzyme